MTRRWLVAGIAALALALVLVHVHVARADAPGAEPLSRGIRAFEARQYKAAEKLFDSALARGGLSRAQTLTTYIDLGVTLVLLGKTRAAERAFDEAALIDPKFVVPAHAGTQAQQLANAARRRQDSIGQYHFDVGAPGEVKAGEAFRVSIEMAADQAALAPLVRFAAEAPGGKVFDTVEPTATHVGVEIPGELAVGGATLALRFELLDNHDNRLAVVDKQVSVGAAPEPKEPKEPKEPGDARPPREPKPAKRPRSDEPDGDDRAGDDDGAWSVAHGTKRYTAKRVDRPPTIDGVLDDEIWKTAPEDARFLSTKSKPFGKPSPEPTVVQVAYDDKNLYVAFRCRYSKPRSRNDAYAGDEQTLLTESENVAVVVDALHGHTGGYEFAVSPAGVRADAELGEQGATQNLDWRGIWDVETRFTGDGWTAEFAIPWGTMYMPSRDEPFDVGINFRRHEPTSGEVSLWSLHPPATELYDVNFFGHLDGLARVRPGQRLLIVPYAALAFDSANPAAQPLLTDLTGSNAKARIYAGGYLRLRPPGPFRLDATINPDFSAVNPDQAYANFDRFELEYPEARAFFAEDAPRFAFGATRYFYGDLGAQLFYSRRVGIDTDRAGLTRIVPILWGVKSVVRDGGSEGAVMNVETIRGTKGLALSDNATIGRFTQTIEGQRVGAIVLARAGDSGGYASGGADAQLALVDRHLQLTGFYAGSREHNATSAAGEGTVGWKSQDVYAKATLLDVGKGFTAPLGYFPIVGVRAETIAAGYTPVVRSDLVQQVFVESQLAIVRDRDSDELVYRRAVIAGSLQTIDGAQIAVQVQPATENVTQAFPIGNGRIMVPVGSYKVLGTQFDLASPPNRTFVYGVHYSGGDLFDGTRRAPGATVGVNLGRLSARLNYVLYILKFADQRESFYGHDVNVSAGFAYTPRARTALVLEADTVAARATAQLTTTVQFGRLSSLVLSVRGTSGSTIDMTAAGAFDAKHLTAILSLSLGASPL